MFTLGQDKRSILLVTGMAMSATWMVEDGVIKIGGSELGRAKSLLATSAGLD